MNIVYRLIVGLCTFFTMLAYSRYAGWAHSMVHDRNGDRPGGAECPYCDIGDARPREE